MTTEQALLVKIMEECDEVSQRASKAIRFGLFEIQEGQLLNNKERLYNELKDLLVAVNIAVGDSTRINGGIEIRVTELETQIREEKINKYLEYSRELGLVKD